MQPVLTLYQDVYPDGVGAVLPAATRMLFVVHGRATIAGRPLADDEAWQGEGPVALEAGECGVTLWRWELTADGPAAWSAPDVGTRALVSAPLRTLPAGDLLWRGDSVAFPPGGCAYRHLHQGPGIRCMIEGGMRVDMKGRSTCYGPGGAWFEAGSDPVFAQAADRTSRFVRVMLLPRAFLGRNSISYLDPADRERPKTQTYKVFVDAPIAFRDGGR